MIARHVFAAFVDFALLMSRYAVTSPYRRRYAAAVTLFRRY